jgi:hypothetical protein
MGKCPFTNKKKCANCKCLVSCFKKLNIKIDNDELADISNLYIKDILEKRKNKKVVKNKQNTKDFKYI